MNDTIKAALLTWDMTIYPRETVSEIHINRIADALRAGAVPPPILVEDRRCRIIDGVHRWKAYRKVFGEDCEIPCILQEFATENDVFLAAIEANAAHGLTYSSFEQTKCVLLAEERGIEKEALANAMHVPLEKIEKILLFKTGSYIRTLGGPSERVPLKPALRQLAGKELTEQQMSANKFSGGMKPGYYVNQLNALIESGLCEWGTEDVLTGLRRLKILLNTKLRGRRSAAA